MRYDFIIDQMVWSYSRLTAFEDCPYLWYRKYIEDLEKTHKFFADYGSFVHSLLQGYFSGELKSSELPARYLSGFRSNVIGAPPNDRIYKSYLTQGKEYFKSFSFPERTILGVEKKYEFQYVGRPFIGFIDLVSEQDSKLFITDHKSHNLKPRSGRKKPTKSDEELDDYLRQLYIYSSPIKEEYGRYPDYLEFNCFRTKTMITEPFSEERFHEVEAWADQRIQEITREENWKPKEDYWFCHHLCDACDVCEFFEE